MDTATGSGLMEEYDLMKQSKYRVYMSNIDKALKNFEYSSEWADLISALGKLNKVISTNSQYQIIPRRIKISKRLAQCMHPALPSGVHLKALESYDVIFSNIGVDRLASELFIYSAGLFPLLGYSAMNVRPTLLSIYEKYFVPLGEKLRPALSGFLSGVFPGLESGQDHFERTSSLLDKVCAAVKPECFYTCLWECIVTNASVRLPAISYVLDHFDKKRHCGDQKELMGSSVELLVTGLCGCLNDAVILVQRNTLEFLLLAFPLHEMVLAKRDVIKLVKTALNTILRRDMSLNRRLYSWLLGADTSLGKHLEDIGHDRESSDPNSYFEIHSKEVLISAFKLILKSSVTSNPVDLSPYRILISLLDKAEIGQRILDDVLCDIIRTISLCNGNLEVQKIGQPSLLHVRPVLHLELHDNAVSRCGPEETTKSTLNRNHHHQRQRQRPRSHRRRTAGRHRSLLPHRVPAGNALARDVQRDDASLPPQIPALPNPHANRVLGKHERTRSGRLAQAVRQDRLQGAADDHVREGPRPVDQHAQQQRHPRGSRGQGDARLAGKKQLRLEDPRELAPGQRQFLRTIELEPGPEQEEQVQQKVEKEVQIVHQTKRAGPVGERGRKCQQQQQLPATILPHFQMYRWAFVSSQNEHYLKPGSYDDSKSVAFIPHVTRISQLMDFRYTSHSPKPQTNKGSHIMLSCQAINTLQDLYSFFSTLSMRWPSHISYTADTEKDTKACLDEVERVLALDFLERMPQTK